jgi:hypothetical protein
MNRRVRSSRSSRSSFAIGAPTTTGGKYLHERLPKSELHVVDAGHPPAVIGRRSPSAEMRPICAAVNVGNSRSVAVVACSGR